MRMMIIIPILVLSAFFCAGCATNASGVEDREKLLIYASFYPMYDLASKAAGDMAEVRCLVPDGTEPHDWEPSTRDMAGLERADLLFYSGAGFERWVPQVVSGLKNSGLKTVETSEGIAVLEGDPHVWLNPMNAKRQFTAICEAFIEADPANAGTYEANMLSWNAEFDRLDAEFGRLRGLSGRKIVVTHGAFGYLCEAYGLEQLAAEGYSPDSEPDPASMARLVSEAEEHGIGVVFYGEASQRGVADAVAREIGARTAALSPLEGLTDEERAAGDDYFSVMRKNLAALAEALG